MNTHTLAKPLARLSLLRLGIRQKVALVLLSALIFALTVSGWLTLQSQKEEILQETGFRGTELARFASQSLANSVVGHDYHAIELWLQEAIKNGDIVYLRVLSAKGNTMAEAGTPPDIAGDATLFKEDIRIDNEVVGRLHLGLSTQRISNNLIEQRSAFIQRESVVILAILLVVFLAISHLIIYPIRRISSVMGVVRRDTLTPDAEYDAGNLEPDTSQSSKGPGSLGLHTNLALAANILPLASSDEIGDLARSFLHLQDRTEHAIQSLRRSEEKNRALVEAMPDTMLRLSRDGICLDCKVPRNAPEILRARMQAGYHIQENLPPAVYTQLQDSLEMAIRTRQIQLFHFVLESNGDQLSFEARVTASNHGEVLVILRDISEQKNLEDQVDFLAHFDNLTQLPNRLLFRERLKSALTHANKEDQLAAVVFMDLDHFKIINDTLGHDSGDLLLQGVAERLQRSLRSSDYISRMPRDEAGPVVSRPGGDEFNILLTQLSDNRDVIQAARRMLEIFSTPFRINGHDITVTASLGISLFPTDGHDAETLIKNADAAMHHAKSEGRNTYQFYTASINAALSRRMVLEKHLRKALEQGELKVHYQPQVDIRTGRITGMESLLRWKQPELGMISPAEFIPLAEDTGLIVPIGNWVLRESCAQNKRWQDAGLPGVRVAVNISGVQFRRSGLVETVRSILQETGLKPEYLELEITEGIILRNDEQVIKSLKELKLVGVKLSLDDFGTGYSSLSYLKRFPLDTLKIDRSFVRDIPEDADDTAITSAILAMAHSLKFEVVAEGVENQKQLEFLRGQGCDLVQGFYYSPAVSADVLAELLRPHPAQSKAASGH